MILINYTIIERAVPFLKSPYSTLAFFRCLLYNFKETENLENYINHTSSEQAIFYRDTN